VQGFMNFPTSLLIGPFSDYIFIKYLLHVLLKRLGGGILGGSSIQ